MAMNSNSKKKIIKNPQGRLWGKDFKLKFRSDIHELCRWYTDGINNYQFPVNNSTLQTSKIQ